METRSFIPPQNEEEQRLVRRIEELCVLAERRSIPRYSKFLSDREQALAQIGIHRAGCSSVRFWGGWPDAERKVLCIEPLNTWQEDPVGVLLIQKSGKQADAVLTHRDYLGSILGLGLDRACLGDIVPTQNEGQVYLFALQDKLEFIAQNLTTVGRVSVQTSVCAEFQPSFVGQTERTIQEVTVSSLRADSVLAAFMRTSRSVACSVIEAGRVEVNHVPLRSAHATVYAQDLFTVRGVGRYRLKEIGGLSKKGRVFISFYQY